MLNSLIVASAVTAIAIFIYSAAGYAFFRNRDKKSINILFGLVMIGIMVPKAVTMIPTFIMASNLHLTNTYIGLIIPPLAIPVGVFLVRQAMFSFPMELVDAAKIDGCSEISAFVRIVMPILAPTLVVVTIYTFMEQWREFVWPLILTTTDKSRTIPVGLSTFSSEFKTDYGIFMAGVVIAILPGIVMFLLFQRQFMKGMTAGALKE
ncbi:MAG: carbohydrate ABC transporter permease [Bacteroidota bacterium]|nr:carbohydrate ABC transporter permease [Bacteroidota bacterium]